MYAALDWLLAALHLALVAFNLGGWIFPRTRRLHLIVISLTLLSWFGLGIWYGWGYCPLTDWHWQVKEALGEVRLPNSWIKYHLDRITNADWNPLAVDAGVLICALAAFAASVWLNIKNHRKRRRGTC